MPLRRWLSPLHIKVLCLCSLWYCIASTGGIIEKLLLSNMPYPMTVSMCQLLSIATYLPPLLYVWGIPRDEHTIPRAYYFRWIVPLAVGKFVSMFSARISIWKVPLSFAHTVKATLPLFTVLVSRFVLKEHHTTQVYASLIIIVTGVVITSATELSFNLVGFISALVSTLVFTIQNIYSKKVLKETGVHHLRLLLLLTRLAVLIALPVWFFYDFFRIAADITNPNSQVIWSKALFFLFLDGVCNFLQNKIAFSLIAMLSSIGYAVTNSSKRVAVIIISIIVLRNPVTLSNVFGMAIALAGVFLYNKAKYDEYKKIETLPRHIDRVLIPSSSSVVKPLLKNGNAMMVTSSQTPGGGSRDFTPEIDSPSGGWPAPVLKPSKSTAMLASNGTLLPNEYSFADLAQAAAASSRLGSHLSVHHATTTTNCSGGFSSDEVPEKGENRSRLPS